MSKISLALLCVLALPTAVNADEQPVPQGPEPLAVSMMQQFYAEAGRPTPVVSVAVMERGVHTAKLRAKTDNGHTCVMDMSEAPEGVKTAHGWMVGSFKC
ncbi:hypothetical protein JFT64_27830 [Pseudomonas carnis]|uniref:hypothetical protein n=1 Tax=Pseudomonas carnis TaxID=2487355 RepID=UPI0018E8C6B6|nr:hypothetical protein [Pseudomonas carnis]MBJ2215847.1 hypothetical protein [Pseudomonas carnis]